MNGDASMTLLDKSRAFQAHSFGAIRDPVGIGRRAWPNRTAPLHDCHHLEPIVSRRFCPDFQSLAKSRDRSSVQLSLLAKNAAHSVSSAAEDRPGEPVMITSCGA